MATVLLFWDTNKKDSTSFEKGLFVTRTISGIDLQLSNTTGILQKENVWFVDVEVQHETRFPFFLF